MFEKRLYVSLSPFLLIAIFLEGFIICVSYTVDKSGMIFAGLTMMCLLAIMHLDKATVFAEKIVLSVSAIAFIVQILNHVL